MPLRQWMKTDAGEDLRDLLVARQGNSASAPRLLLPFDGSQSATHAARYVARNVAGLAATVQLLNVQRATVTYPGVYDGAHGIVAAHREAGERVLREARRELDASAVEYVAEVCIGPVPETIARLAAERGCAFIVMGTRGRLALVNLLTGSVPAHVARIARVPVLLVQHATAARLRLPRPVSAPYIAA